MRLWLVMLGTLPLLAVGSGAVAGTKSAPHNGLIATRGADGLYLIDAKTATKRLVPGTAEATGATAWSPDGRLLAFEASDNIYSVAADGTGLRLIVKNAWSPSWSPDGRRLVVVQEDCRHDACNSDEFDSTNLFLVDADGANLRQLTFFADGVDSPVWSPDGKWIAFVGAGGIDVVEAKDGKSRWLLQPDEMAHDIAWSPDKNWIAFVGSDGIYLMHDLYDIPELLSSEAFAENLSWSPDGSKLVFDHTLDLGPRMEIAVIDVATRKQERSMTGFSPIWSPDGKELAYLANGAKPSASEGGCGGHTGGDVWTMNADGTAPRRAAKGDYGQLSWGAEVAGLTAATTPATSSK